MNRRRFVLRSGFALVLGSQARTAIAAQSRSWDASLPEGVSFDPITDPTSEDLLRASRLAAVARMTWEPGAEFESPCFDPDTGGSEIILVEQGSLNIEVREPSDLWIESLPATNLPTAFLRSQGSAPVTVVPDTELDLGPGDAIVFPAGSVCRKGTDSAAGVTALQINLLPGRTFPRYEVEDLGIAVELFDINFGARTLHPSAPPVVVAGRLVIDAGGSLDLASLAMPLALFVESGEASLNARHEGGLLRDVSLRDNEPSTVLPSGEQVTLNTGQSAYLPSTSTGTLGATASVTFMLVGINTAAISSDEISSANLHPEASHAVRSGDPDRGTL